MNKKLKIGVGYSILTMVFGPLWHFLLFKGTYDSLGIYNRAEPIIPLGFASMILQSVLLSILFDRYYNPDKSSYGEGLRFSLLMGLFMFSTTTMANAAKMNVTSMSIWFLVQLGFHIVQFGTTGLMIGYIYSKSSRV